jgi:uncharacterized membrane protein YdjX (TVP38/TMEM64 family)
MSTAYARLLLVLLLILLGFVMQWGGLTDIPALLSLAREYAQYWWLIPILILLQALLFSFALAGSLFLWIVAPLYPPAMATLILALGGTLGGVGAYLLSRYLSGEWRHRIENSHGYRLLQSQDDFLTLFTMRVFPGFPHSIVNFSAGMLKARMGHFIIAALLGISIKSYVYANVIFTASDNFEFEMLLDVGVIGPLLALSLASAATVIVRYCRSISKP